MDTDLEWRMWRQLRGGFNIDRFIFTPVMPEMNNVDVEQYDTMAEALDQVSMDIDRVFLEPSGYNGMHDIPHGGDIALIVGDSSTSNIEHALVNETYAIKAPSRLNAYGINAAAIALAYGYGQ